MSASAGALQALLRQPRVAADPYAQLRCLDRLRQLAPGNVPVLQHWQQTMLLANRPGPVWAVLSARHDDPAGQLHGDELMLVAQVAQAVGQTDTARACYQALTRQFPHSVDVWQKYVEFESPGHHPEGLEATLQDLADGAGNDYGREKALFTLASYWRRRDPQRAFVCADHAHELKWRRLGPWDKVGFLKGLAIDRQRQPQSGTGALDPGHLRPVFIVGLPRSGTTLLSSLLASHSRIGNAGEQGLLPVLARGPCRQPLADNETLRQFSRAWYLAAVADLAGDAVAVIDKLPANVQYAGLILELFPDAVLIHIRRQRLDCALSIYLHDFEYGQQYANRAQDLAAYAGAIDGHMAAIAQQAQGRCFTIDYEALVDQPETLLTPVLAALGLDWQPAMLEFWRRGTQVATYSDQQVRQPLNRQGINTWPRYRPAADAFLGSIDPDTLAAADARADTAATPLPVAPNP
ncbi:MAG: sulfotransferase [Xanthomonadales bacterium]|nr:sulfotransferase [Xanthomonadales bacterium]